MTKSEKALHGYFYRCKREVLRGDRDPAGPGEVVDLIAHKGFNVPPLDAEQFKARWKRNDNAIHRNYAESYKMTDQLPPCHDCPPMVVAFCASSGRECKAFATWTVEGTRRLTVAEAERGVVRQTKNSDRTKARRELRRKKKREQSLAS